jgi:hypothetical protein
MVLSDIAGFLTGTICIVGLGRTGTGGALLKKENVLGLGFGLVPTVFFVCLYILLISVSLIGFPLLKLI